jgi:hypothetical protein
MATNHGKGVGASVLCSTQILTQILSIMLYTHTIQAHNSSPPTTKTKVLVVWVGNGHVEVLSPSSHQTIPPFGIHSINSHIRTHNFCWSCLLPRHGYCV